MLTESGCSLTLVDILEVISITFQNESILEYCCLSELYGITHLAGTSGSSNVFEALRAQALVGANGVLAATVQSADATTVNAALIDVNAVIVGPGRVSRRTDAVIPALPILAGLTLVALVRSLPTFVYVNAILSGRGVQSVTGSADHP